VPHASPGGYPARPVVVGPRRDGCRRPKLRDRYRDARPCPNRRRGPFAVSTSRDGEASRGAPARGLQFGGTLADSVLVGDRVPACRATLAGPSDPAGCLQLSEKVEYLIAVSAGLLGERSGGESIVVG